MPPAPVTHSSATGSPAITGRADVRECVVGWPEPPSDQHLSTGVTPGPLAPDRPADIRSHHHAPSGRPGDASAMACARGQGTDPEQAARSDNGRRTHRRQVPHLAAGNQWPPRWAHLGPVLEARPVLDLLGPTGSGRRRFRLMSPPTGDHGTIARDAGPRPGVGASDRRPGGAGGGPGQLGDHARLRGHGPTGRRQSSDRLLEAPRGPGAHWDKRRREPATPGSTLPSRQPCSPLGASPAGSMPSSIDRAHTPAAELRREAGRECELHRSSGAPERPVHGELEPPASAFSEPRTR